MKRVHILTFHRALNYGAVLQCYALYSTIKNYTECDVIDYRASCIEERYKVFRKDTTVKTICKALLSKKSVNKKRKKFDRFINENIKTTSSISTKPKLEEMCLNSNDTFCVGSDQVWNLTLIKNDFSYFFDFLPEKAKKVSYAASIGENIENKQEHIFEKYLQLFGAISVREKTAQEQLNKIGIDSVLCIDPVFLLSKKEWEKIAAPIQKEKGSYILIYMLQKSDSFMKKAVEYSRKKNKKVVIISTGLKREYDAEYIADCGPDEFVSYFIMADTIFTNSFHGISFSILLNKNFYYELQGNCVKTNSRLTDVINIFNLQNREVSNLDDDSLIDYSKTNRILQDKRLDSLAYIENNII